MQTNRTYSSVRILVECAMMIAIGTVLSNIKIFEMPNGGSITLVSMLPFILVSYRHGVRWGMATGFVNSLLQMMLGWWAPPAGTLTAYVGMILLDYVLAFTLLGLAAVFAKPFGGPRKPLGAAVGAAVVCCRRGGATAAFDSLNKYFTIANMPVVPSQYWNMVHGANADDAQQDAEGLQTMRTLARNMAWMLRCFEAGRKAGISVPTAEPIARTNFIR